MDLKLKTIIITKFVHRNKVCNGVGGIKSFHLVLWIKIDGISKRLISKDGWGHVLLVYR